MGQIVGSSPSFLSQFHITCLPPHPILLPIPHHLQISRSSRSPKGIVGQIVGSSPSFLSQTHTHLLPRPSPPRLQSPSPSRLVMSRSSCTKSKRHCGSDCRQLSFLSLSVPHHLLPPHPLPSHTTPSADRLAVQKALWVHLPPPSPPSPSHLVMSRSSCTKSKRQCGSDCRQLSFLSLSVPHHLLPPHPLPPPPPASFPSFSMPSGDEQIVLH